MATKQLTAAEAYVLPRVNLLPPEIGAKRAERRSYTVMGIAVAGAVAAVAALYIGQAARVSSAKGELRTAQAENTRLKSKRAGLQPIQDVYAAVDADEALVSRAFETRVYWSVYLHNVSISIPDNVWITQFTGTVGGLTPQAAPPAPGSVAPLGTLSFAGKAFEYNDVAAWLDSVARLKGVANASFTRAEDEKPLSPKGRTVVKFTSTASLTSAAITPHTKPGSR